ncbi:hypothetical protein LZZ90_07500 [Flavobacterium sp. SM15]|uniref:hypothetical protein n=1 Tax=Flavobacterium sp. SM15 TaxID=2908005 RepID=UPI001EDC1C2B|nr:hypothetical protein [Flavobacterium sp. SM15]MCG2611349.1 hypothetical protein [Flavobacterium sp. SM15]
MKNLLLFSLLIITGFTSKAQNLYLKIEGNSTEETKIIDSIGYKSKHPDTKSIIDETKNFSSILTKNGYLETEFKSQKKINDSTFLFKYHIGKKTNLIHIYIGGIPSQEKKLLELSADTLKIKLSEVDNFMNRNLANLEQKGYSLSELQLVNHKKENNHLLAELKIKTENKRKLNNIVILGYPKFPEGIRRNIVKQFQKKTFNQENLKQLHSLFKALPFTNQTKYPEILFTKDNTKAYVYLEKTRSNRFEGFIGFSNDENSGTRFIGYLDLLLNNALNTGEKFNLYWKSDGKKQTSFNIGTELPYIFKTPLGIKANLRIFKQDSIFQNTTTDLNLGYYFQYNSKVYLGYQSEESIDIQKSNTSLISGFKSTFWTASYEFFNFNPENYLFKEKTNFFIKTGTGKRNSKLESNNQYFILLEAFHNFNLNKKNLIYIKNQSFFLQSPNYIANELHRFGGINSIRGFSENSLQASSFSGFMTEYRYLLTQNMYLHSITDYGYFQDKSSNFNNNLLGLGLGLGIATKNGILNLIYANGSSKGETIKLSNSIIHISFKTIF